MDINTGALKTILEKAPVEMKNIIGAEFNEWGIKTINKAKGRAPYRTGNLKQSIFAKKVSDFTIDAWADTRVGPIKRPGASANVEYAKYVEPPPLGVPMSRKMKRTTFLYNSAMEELEVTVQRLQNKLTEYLSRSR